MLLPRFLTVSSWFPVAAVGAADTLMNGDTLSRFEVAGATRYSPAVDLLLLAIKLTSGATQYMN
ncbi:hypothetical protein QC763_0020330 [Podospora pseudopauciseta]|uniref:Uncharacterized protein n=1 Tax=Podospora pseudopauciseta TaxID=2093780 RepID=A0ABR0I115_9PEZI|nr:hypothetical protein QC763_0020330 [Podospora pseudopauciseta]